MGSDRPDSPSRKSPSPRRRPRDRSHDHIEVPSDQIIFVREYWTGDSRDGALVNGDGYHYYRMTKAGLILEAFEYYETDDGAEATAPLPEMLHVHWKDDLGFSDFEALDHISESEFNRVKGLVG
jgi:hypothetical protein